MNLRSWTLGAKFHKIKYSCGIWQSHEFIRLTWIFQRKSVTNHKKSGILSELALNDAYLKSWFCKMWNWGLIIFSVVNQEYFGFVFFFYFTALKIVIIKSGSSFMLSLCSFFIMNSWTREAESLTTSSQQWRLFMLLLISSVQTRRVVQCDSAQI